MSYLTIARIYADPSMMRRITAAAAQEGHAEPATWAAAHMWALAAQPGWEQAWESAIAAGATDPGADEACITDGMILTAVQAEAGRQAS